MSRNDWIRVLSFAVPFFFLTFLRHKLKGDSSKESLGMAFAMGLSGFIGSIIGIIIFK